MDNDGIMSLVKPFEDKDTRDAVRRKGYRCISHLWEIPPKNGLSVEEKKKHKEKYVWKTDKKEEKGNKDYHRIKGITWEVECRKKKRDKLFQIFNDRKGYFWMDNLCVNQSAKPKDKPLGVMIDIYRMCTECICMLDYNWGDDEMEVVACGPDSPNSLKNKARNYILEVARCKWFRRVWTVQEWYFPPKSYYTMETETDDGIRLVSRENFNLLHLIAQNYKAFEDPGMTVLATSPGRLANVVRLFSYLKATKRVCTAKKDYYYGIAGILGVRLEEGMTYEEAEMSFLGALRGMGRSVSKSSNERGPYGFYGSLTPLTHPLSPHVQERFRSIVSL